MKRIVLNTDIFGDPDDLYALLFLLDSKFKIELIITSDEHKCGRAEYLQKFLNELGEDIPVYCGEDLGNTRCYFAPKQETTKIERDYVAALESLKNKFTFVCISSQSELAKCLDIIKERKAEVLIMGGSTRKDEHNVKCNIPAAKNVMQSKINAKWVPSDLTWNEKIKIDKQHPLYKSIFASRTIAAKYLQENTNAFFKKIFPANYLHDPLAISILFDPKIINFEKKEFELKNARFVPSTKGFKLKWGVSADYDRFWNVFNSPIEKQLRRP